MPQMKPLNWFMLYMTISLFIMTVMNFLFFEKKIVTPSKQIKLEAKNLIWKW